MHDPIKKVFKANIKLILDIISQRTLSGAILQLYWLGMEIGPLCADTILSYVHKRGGG
jgi:hypothetical protein